MFHLIYKAYLNMLYLVNIIFMQKQSVGPQTGQVTPKGSLVPHPMDLDQLCQKQLENQGVFFTSRVTNLITKSKRVFKPVVSKIYTTQTIYS